MRTHALNAVFRRNFVSYFSSPIGYVFICAFVLLSAFAAFWPNEFFNANLANLDQLNASLPWILLVFVPAITMGVWAEEAHRGTDELLLTIPAGDLEIVLGKYLAAFAIYTVSLLFSISNIVVLVGLGEPDVGLLVANYIGYWFVGAAMIAIGMTASFVSSNLTVGFVLAAAFNAPLVFASFADTIVPWERGARFIGGLSIAEQFTDFGRGVISLSSVVYFVSIAILFLYVSMILIGRRHWWDQSRRRRGTAGAVGTMLSTWGVAALLFGWVLLRSARRGVVGRGDWQMWMIGGLAIVFVLGLLAALRRGGGGTGLHYAARTACLAVAVIGVNTLVTGADVRLDVTSERLSSLSDDTVTLLEEAGVERPVFIEAYISPDVPEEYVQTRLNLLSMLRELDARGGDRIVVRLNETERFSEAAAEAIEQFGIAPQTVTTSAGGRFSAEEIFLGVAVLSGLDTVVVPFFDHGIPVEYELIRSVTTVSRPTRRRLGFVSTDARMFGGFDMETFSSRPDQPMITELRKQYEVIQVDATAPVPPGLDVLVVVQPSSLPQTQLDNVLDAIRAGTPTAVFEDPFPYFDPAVPGTVEPRRPANRNPFAQQPPPEPKGDIRDLWSLLQVRFQPDEIIWDRYNPYPKLTDLPPEFVFIDDAAGDVAAFSPSHPVSSGFQQVLVAFAGAVLPLPNATGYEPLMFTGDETGTVFQGDLLTRNMFGQPVGINPDRRLVATGTNYVMAAEVRGTEANPDVHAVVVGDIDLLYPVFFALRARGDQPDAPVSIALDNVPFVLNVIDRLAGDDRFIEIRKRRPTHRTLTAVERRTADARARADARRDVFDREYEGSERAERDAFQQRIAELQTRTDIDPQQLLIEVQMAQEAGNRRLEATLDRLRREREEATEGLERELSLEIRRVQQGYKLAAVALPPIPPLIVALVVYARRRRLETIGVPPSRLRTA